MTLDVLGHLVEVDRNRCEGHAQCVATAPGFFTIDENGELGATGTDTATSAVELEHVEMAVSACPMNALRLIEPRPADPSHAPE
ncbi:ferredoxin [Mycolicibacterium smegmatis]|uniref:Fe3S4 ferredoxin n=3 Tax=Mycobacteriaceae TaxID=1762 RepID=I7GBG0_MYCS2|nr:ferredoxin [Mycolicibacterium smegmatis]VTP02681.1 hypothetical protein BIN_B_04628 [Mycobacterium riyadhense]ABK74107.1 conserved domain protein [Mycolicibacterium smegmatis MC2 155]AFP40511.1 Fe3S4 ferredoxin [Mycolicibacterium smegmatis MC2 155]AIU09249.1 3Fe-4S ferredoxin [Mycolicibacterium smegmatis MC2 155]AIU15874.1 3Fe-4S ferredoxin [Mycolicibacterium smegmatis]